MVMVIIAIAETLLENGADRFAVATYRSNTIKIFSQILKL